MLLKSLSNSLKSCREFLKNKRVLITGGRGFIGCNLIRNFENNLINFIAPDRSEYDLANEIEVRKLFSKENIDIVIHLAGDSGSITYMRDNAPNIYYNNIMMNTLIVKYCVLNSIEVLLALNTVNAYPFDLKAPYSEDSLHNGLPDKNTSGYGMAKRMMIFQSDLYSKKYVTQIINLIADNIYGPHDIFTPGQSRVIPANIYRCIEANIRKNNITVWGSGKVRRDFIFVDDIVSAINFAITSIKKSTYLNIGSGDSITIKELIYKIAEHTEFTGKINWDISKPEGQLIRYLDVEKINNLGFNTKTSIDEGIKKTVKWYLSTAL